MNLENAGSWFTLANFPISVAYPNFKREVVTLKVARINFEDQKLKFVSSYLQKINTTEYGVVDLSEEKSKNLDKISYESFDNARDFKVIKTPISNRTFIIGGKTSKTIKEIYNEDINNIKVILFVL